ncbi:hypothetical protein ACHAQH_005607 [Verticillium albo-atrum]
MARPKRFAEFEEKTVKDYDPEADSAGENDQSGSGSGSEDEGADLAGTEHYLNVGKSKLRQKENVSLGPQYRGSRISRQALEDSEGSEDFEDAQEDFDSDNEEYDDPETADLAIDQARAEEDAEISSDDALGESDDEKLDKFVFRGSSKPIEEKGKGGKKKRPTAADFISGSEDEEGQDEEQEEDSDASGGVDLMDVEAEEESGESGSGDEDEDDEEDDSDLDGFINDDSEGEDEEEDDGDASGSGSDDDEETPKLKKSSRAADARAEQRKLMNEGQKALVATISAATQQDAAKGLAVRQQRKTFDGLLNIRIRLQKAIVATNSFSAFDGSADDEAEPYSAAEEAALKLLGTLDSVRATLIPSTTTSASSTPDKKRKRDTSTEALWAALQETDARAAKHRRKVLDTWSSKTRNATVEVKSRNLVSSQQSLVASLEDQLFNSDRLLKRARTPRSCAPVQVAAKINEDTTVYDDADFYQILLKELVEQRTSDETAAQASGGALATVRWAAMKEARTKKHVDRRASKGRKMRFNIHEKLQNFMAPEDRRGWEQEAIDRLFGTLFGQRMVLAEGAGEDVDEEMEEGKAEEEGLRLFRS